MKNPRCLMVLAMAIFGTIPLFVRHLPLSSGEIALYRVWMAALPVGLVLWIGKQKISRKALKSALPWLLLSGGALGFNWILLFEAYNYTTVSTATLCYYFAPILVTVASRFLFRERMTPLQILCFVMSTVGLLLITGMEGAGREDLLGIALGLGAACLYAAVVLINKKMENVSGLYRTFLQFVITGVILLPYVALTGGFHLHALQGLQWGTLLTVGLVHTGVAYCLYFSSVHRIPGQKVAIISYLDPLIAVLISVFALGETITPLQILGGVMILGFSLLNELLPSKR